MQQNSHYQMQQNSIFLRYEMESIPVHEFCKHVSSGEQGISCFPLNRT